MTMMFAAGFVVGLIVAIFCIGFLLVLDARLGGWLELTEAAARRALHLPPMRPGAWRDD